MGSTLSVTVNYRNVKSSLDEIRSDFSSNFIHLGIIRGKAGPQITSFRIIGNMLPPSDTDAALRLMCNTFLKSFKCDNPELQNIKIYDISCQNNYFCNENLYNFDFDLMIIVCTQHYQNPDKFLSASEYQHPDRIIRLIILENANKDKEYYTNYRTNFFNCDIPIFFVNPPKLQLLLNNKKCDSYYDETAFVDYIKKVTFQFNNVVHKSVVCDNISWGETVTPPIWLDNKMKPIESTLVQILTPINTKTPIITTKDVSSNTEFIAEDSLSKNDEIFQECIIKQANVASAADRKLMLEEAIKKHDIGALKNAFQDNNDDEEVITEQHEMLKLSIKNKFLEAVLYFIECKQWKNIFHRHACDTQSPIQLLLIYMPETCKILFDKCVNGGDQKYLSELINDYPINSKTLKDTFYAWNVAIRKKYEKFFGCPSVEESHVKQE